LDHAVMIPSITPPVETEYQLDGRGLPSYPSRPGRSLPAWPIGHRPDCPRAQARARLFGGATPHTFEGP
jgi:hypothetical protein